MEPEPSNLAGGVVLVLFGLFLVLRTVVTDSHGHTLATRILSLGGGAGGSGRIRTDFAPGTVPATPLNVAAQATARVPGIHQVAKANQGLETWEEKLPVVGPLNKKIFDWVNSW